MRYQNVDTYIADQPTQVIELLESVRTAIKKAAPQAQEVISYNMPAYKQNGMLVWFAAHSRHIGFYPRGSGIEEFMDELSGYKVSKGTIQFPFDKPLPIKLISKIVKFRVAENIEWARQNKK